MKRIEVRMNEDKDTKNDTPQSLKITIWQSKKNENEQHLIKILSKQIR